MRRSVGIGRRCAEAGDPVEAHVATSPAYKGEQTKPVRGQVAEYAFAEGGGGRWRGGWGRAHGASPVTRQVTHPDLGEVRRTRFTAAWHHKGGQKPVTEEGAVAAWW